jgi:hypothetical protein
MAEKTISARFKVRRDTTANWNAAIGFIPLEGEVIVYTDYKTITEGNVTKYVPGIKIGSGNAYVQDLAFVGDADMQQILAALNTKQDVIDRNHKLDYSLIANTPQEIHIQYNASGVEVAREVMDRVQGSIVYLEYGGWTYPLIREWGGQSDYYSAVFGGWDGNTSLCEFTVLIASLDDPFTTTTWTKEVKVLPTEADRARWNNKLNIDDAQEVQGETLIMNRN